MDDYISREAALNAIYTSTAPALEVKAIPAADVAPVRHGRFTTYRAPFIAQCSECGTFMNTHWRYCPTCGAKMVEREIDY